MFSVTKAAVLTCLLLVLSGPGQAETRPLRTHLGGETPKSILWVGNSFFYYNNSLHSHVLGLVKAADPAGGARATSVTISGSGLDWHDMTSLLRPNGVGRYSFVGDNEIKFNKAGRQFDAVIMMDCSQCPVHPQLKDAFRATVKKDSAIVTGYGARPILFMSWAYKDKPEMTAHLAEAYTAAGNAGDALVIPAGLAFARAIAQRPDLELYQADKRHPTMAGTYLAACASYAAIYGKSPVGNAYRAGLEPGLAEFLQTIAADTLRDYFAH